MRQCLRPAHLQSFEAVPPPTRSSSHWTATRGALPARIVRSPLSTLARRSPGTTAPAPASARRAVESTLLLRTRWPQHRRRTYWQPPMSVALAEVPAIDGSSPSRRQLLCSRPLGDGGQAQAVRRLPTPLRATPSPEIGCQSRLAGWPNRSGQIGGTTDATAATGTRTSCRSDLRGHVALFGDAADSATPARLRFRTAVRRRSWNSSPGTPAAWQARFQLIRKSLMGTDPRANKNSLVRVGDHEDQRPPKQTPMFRFWIGYFEREDAERVRSPRARGQNSWR